MGTIRTFSSRDFNQFVSEAKRAANDGPVFITDRGEPAHVLLTIADYRKLQGNTVSLLEALAQPGEEADFDFEPPRTNIQFRPADLS